MNLYEGENHIRGVTDIKYLEWLCRRPDAILLTKNVEIGVSEIVGQNVKLATPAPGEILVMAELVCSANEMAERSIDPS
ncbi:hypothetical protein NF675_14635 [Pseudomonas siliginis]|uniref:hypothetical protein n=1 Tax=Pseudomonas siliginis TaxID=2842346 RepID=UPI00209368A6|nr:hypothetical protein [Pseudomonas siliginis]UST72261.1 hypothetical protein NF675_14635 [Pseudomonas siliginis]